LELPLELEPMFGQDLPLGAAGFWAGEGVVVEGVVVEGVVVEGVLAALVLCVVVAVVAAPALAMPAAAPAVANAPATMVAPSSLEMVIGSNLLGSIGGCVDHRVRRR
jgi:hypothetical protein